MGAQAISCLSKNQRLVYTIPPFSYLSVMASVDAVKCSRCLRMGHCAKDCALPFARKFTVAEMRLKRATEAAQEKAEWEAKQAKVSACRAVKQAEFAMYRAAKGLA